MYSNALKVWTLPVKSDDFFKRFEVRAVLWAIVNRLSFIRLFIMKLKWMNHI